VGDVRQCGAWCPARYRCDQNKMAIEAGAQAILDTPAKPCQRRRQPGPAYALMRMARARSHEVSGQNFASPLIWPITGSS